MLAQESARHSEFDIVVGDQNRIISRIIVVVVPFLDGFWFGGGSGGHNEGCNWEEVKKCRVDGNKTGTTSYISLFQSRRPTDTVL